jgi:hypothetical protein
MTVRGLKAHAKTLLHDPNTISKKTESGRPALQVIIKFLKYEFRQITMVLVQVVFELQQMMLDDSLQRGQYPSAGWLSGVNVQSQK